MVDQRKLSSRLDALETYLVELRPFREFSHDEFARNSKLHHLAERFLHLACEAVLDIAHHVIADQGYRQATNYRNAMEILADEGLLEEDLAQRLQRWMGLRNVLVHLYLGIDHGKIYEVIQNDLGDLEAFAARMARFLEP